jgi:hypothetical protein
VGVSCFDPGSTHTRPKGCAVRYYFNAATMLRTHCTAHTPQLLAKGESAFLVSGDVCARRSARMLVCRAPLLDCCALPRDAGAHAVTHMSSVALVASAGECAALVPYMRARRSRHSLARRSASFERAAF